MTDSRCEPCRVIVYAPEESDALTRDRWKCARCGAPFEPAGQMQEELRATQAALDRLAKRYAEQETEIEMAEREYKDSEGNVVTLDKLVRIEPEWAANIIRWYEGKLDEAERCAAQRKAMLEGCGAALRDVKQRAESAENRLHNAVSALDEFERDAHDFESKGRALAKLRSALVVERPVQPCEHGEGLTDYCLPCGRVNGGG